MTKELAFWLGFSLFAFGVIVYVVHQFWLAHFEKRKLRYFDPSPYRKQRGLTAEEKAFVKHIRVKYE